MNVIYHGHIGRPTGYSRAAHDYIEALLAVGVSVRIEPFDRDVLWEADERFDHLRELIGVGSEKGVHVYHDMPGRLVDRKVCDGAVAITTWETSDLPDELADPLATRFDRVIVPSPFCQGVFAAAAVEAITVPHAIDPDFWNPDALQRDDHDDVFTFYTVGLWNDRKNVADLLRAYLATFRREDDVRLVIHSRDPDIIQAKQILSQSGIPKEDLPRLLINPHDAPGGFATEGQLRQIHLHGDCFVSMTRCEGWGLGAFEALAMNRPVLMPHYGGQASFVPGEGVRYRLTPCFPTERLYMEGGELRARRDVAKGVDCTQKWADPDILDMSARMEAAIDGQFKMQARDRIVRLYNHEAVGEKLAAALGKV